MIRASLATVLRDGWVIGIACAAAIAYVVVTFVENLVSFALSLIDGVPRPTEELRGGVPEDFYRPAYSFVFRDHYVPYEGLLRATILLVVVVFAAAIALHLTREAEEDTAD
jgi:hypothetical protein